MSLLLFFLARLAQLEFECLPIKHCSVATHYTPALLLIGTSCAISVLVAMRSSGSLLSQHSASNAFASASHIVRSLGQISAG